MAYRPGSAAFNFTVAPYRPPKPLDFNFDGTPDIDIVPPPAITTSISARWEKSNAKDRSETRSGWQSPPEKQQAAAAAWGTASQASVHSFFSWSEVERKELELSFGWSKSAQADAVDDRPRWLEISPKDSFAVARWDRSLQAKDMRRMLLAYRLLVPAKDAVTQIGGSNDGGHVVNVLLSLKGVQPTRAVQWASSVGAWPISMVRVIMRSV